MPPDIAVVVPTYRRAVRLRRLLEALASQTLPADRWELVVVDDCSEDAELDALLRELPHLVPCSAMARRTAQNGGPAVARNLGWRAASAPVVAFIDDDVVPDPDWLESGLREFDDPTMGVVQGRTCLPDGVDWLSLPPWWLWRTIEDVSPFFEGCNIFYRRAALDQTTGFDEELAWWGEDTAAGWQVLEAGWRNGFAADAVATHDIEHRPVSWWVRNGWLEHHLIELAARHPGFRQDAFWRSWAFRQRDAAFVLAVVSGIVGLRWPLAFLGVLPYARRALPVRENRTLRACLEVGVVDAVRSAGHIAGAVRHRVLVI